MTTPALELVGVSKAYATEPPTQVLHGIDLRVDRGEFVAVVGPSGSGKSTLMNIVGTLDLPTDGVVRVAGHDTSTLSDAQLSALRGREIGFVFQQFFLLSGKTTVENVADGLLYRGLPRREREERARATLERVGLGHRLDHQPEKLSGGERQRVAIARALVGSPAVILADEPTGNLDTASGEAVMALLRELHDEGATIVVITHDREIAASIPRQVAIRDGRIESDGPPVESVSRLASSHLNQRDGDPSRLHASDVLRVGGVGLRSRRLRAFLSALGIAIGIGAMVGVLGISDSSRADLLKSLDRLGTNLLTVQAGQGIGGGGSTSLPDTAATMLARIGPVETVASVTSVDATVRRTDFVDEDRTSGISVRAAVPALLDTLGGTVAAGRWLDATGPDLPVVVLGSIAADRLGVPVGARVWLGDRWFSVAGILDPLDLAPDIDRAALIGTGAAAEIDASFDADTPESVYLRTDPDSIEAVADVAPATANVDSPDEVEVSRPSDAIEARAAASTAYTSLFLGLGAVALLVGGVGIANVMVISVLERRSEIGLRRALGATRRHVSLQFLTEALLLSFAGGVAGVLLGALVTVGYALTQGWDILVPAVALGGGLGVAVLIGGLAGVYPALRAARLSPTEALRTV